MNSIVRSDFLWINRLVYIDARGEKNLLPAARAENSLPTFRLFEAARTNTPTG